MARGNTDHLVNLAGELPCLRTPLHDEAIYTCSSLHWSKQTHSVCKRKGQRGLELDLQETLFPSVKAAFSNSVSRDVTCFKLEEFWREAAIQNPLSFHTTPMTNVISHHHMTTQCFLREPNIFLFFVKMSALQRIRLIEWEVTVNTSFEKCKPYVWYLAVPCMWVYTLQSQATCRIICLLGVIRYCVHSRIRKVCSEGGEKEL